MSHNYMSQRITYSLGACQTWRCFRTGKEGGWTAFLHLIVHILQYIKSLKYSLYDDVIKWRHFPRYWSFVRGIHRLPVNSPHRGQWRGALMFSLISTWTNGWVNNSEAGDLRRHRAHCDVTVMRHIDSCKTLIVCHLIFLNGNLTLYFQLGVKGNNIILNHINGRNFLSSVDIYDNKIQGYNFWHRCCSWGRLNKNMS